MTEEEPPQKSLWQIGEGIRTTSLRKHLRTTVNKPTKTDLQTRSNTRKTPPIQPRKFRSIPRFHSSNRPFPLLWASMLSKFCWQLAPGEIQVDRLRALRDIVETTRVSVTFFRTKERKVGGSDEEETSPQDKPMTLPQLHCVLDMRGALLFRVQR